MRHLRIPAFVSTAVTATLVSVGTPGTVQGQEPAPGTWTFLSRANADLWFHGLAVVGFEGFAPMPLYNHAQAERTEAAKRAAGVYPTPLDTLASRLRAGFQQDSTFELLHFVPLYFGLSEVGEMLDAVEGAADGDRPTDFGTNVVSTVLQSRSQRRLLKQFVTALRQEWEIFYRSHRAGRHAELAGQVAAAQRTWDYYLAPALDPFLTDRNLLGGVVLASEPVGAEGRIFSGEPEDPTDNVVAAMLPVDEAGSAALSVVRELCYPLVSGLVEQLGIGAGDRVSAERVSSRAAVQCGAMLLEQHAPNFVDQYRRLFLEAVSESEATPEAFARRFPVDAELQEALRSEVGGR